MVMAYLYIWMARSMKGNDKWINSMDRGLKYGRMERFIKGSINKGKKMGRGSFNGLMGICIMGNLRME